MNGPVQTESPAVSPLELIGGIWNRRKWLALVAFAAPLAAVIPLVLFLPKIYQSEAVIVVEQQQVPEAFVRPTVTSELELRLQTISQEVLSRRRLEPVIARFDLYPELRDRVPLEDLIQRMRGDIKLELKQAEGGRGHRQGRQAIAAFSLSYRGGSPNTVALVTNALASFYIEENLRVRERQATGTAEFLKTQLEETKKRLDEQERNVSEFKKRHIGELPQQLQANLAALERLTVQLRINADNQTRTAERRETLAKQLAEADPQSSPTEGPDAPATRLARLRQELTALRVRFSDKYPDVIRVKGEIAAIERQLTEPKPTQPQPSAQRPPMTPQLIRLRQDLTDVETLLKVLRSEEKQLRTTIAELNQRVENTPRREQEIQEISRDYETMRAVYNSLLTRSQEAQLAESMEQRQKGEQFRLLDPAVPSHDPVAPRASRFLLVGLALSVGLAGAAVLLAEQLDTTLHSLDQLRGATTMPVLAAIPRIVTPADATRARLRFRLAAGAALLGLLLVVTASYVVAKGSQQLVSLLTAGGS